MDRDANIFMYKSRWRVTKGEEMAEKATKSKEDEFSHTLLDALIEDPTRSNKQLAEDLMVSRQRLWRERKRMEDEGRIWGYTTVIDEAYEGWIDCIVLIRLKPFAGTDVASAIKKAKAENYRKYSVRVRDTLYVDGEYDAVIAYSAPDIMRARRFYEHIRNQYDDLLLEKPILLEVNFALRRMGKVNPRVEDLKGLVP
jgi:DNA-binding Lrp family transcriptional regulator